jgi:tetratricopeptide (TPR) repeat protein
LAQALQQEIDNPTGIRITIWPEEVDTRLQALQVGQALSATLVIYGEYDVGRVMVAFAHPADQNAFADPALQQYVSDVQDLSAAINTDLPQQVRSLALLALGQIYVSQDQPDQALPLLIRAREYLQDTPAVDDTTWGLVNFYLGLAQQGSRSPDLDAAIDAYTEAIKVWPGLLSSRLNRSAAYAIRAQPGDLELALADINSILSTKPDWPLAYSNRASILISMGGEDNFSLAQADLDRALKLDPNLPGAFVQQAFLAFVQGKPMAEMAPDLERALSYRPEDASALTLLCWGYVVEQAPEQALPYCQQAIDLDPDPALIDSRGLAYAQMGDVEAALVDFEAYIAWLETQSDEAWQPVLARRRAWVAALNAGENPITPAVLAEIRHEYGK